MSKHAVRGGDVARLLERFAQLRKKALARTGKVFPFVVIQEAGLDGFWIDRVLRKEGIESHVVDPASITTSRRRRRAMAERDVLLAVQQGAAPAPAAMLLNIKGIGPEFAAILWSEGLFRHFDNRRQVASYAGLAPTPWQSGSVDREQGVSKAGNPRLRTTLIQLAWLWLRNQPQSALALWFKERVNRNGGRLKKTTIVALARKLLVALWKYVTAGVVIEGAIVKSA